MTDCPSCRAEIVPGDRFCSRCGAELLDPVSQQIQTGRRLIFLCAYLTLGLHFVVEAFNLVISSGIGRVITPECVNMLVSVSLEAALLYLIYLGYAWARWLTGLLSLAALAFLIYLLPQLTGYQGVLLLSTVVALGMAINSGILLLAPSVRTFQRVQRERRLTQQRGSPSEL